MKYYKVQVLLGHVGCGKGVPAWLYIKAESMLEAVDSAREFPGVKHSRLPLQSKKISYEEYRKGVENSDYKEKMTLIFNCEDSDNKGVD